MISLKLSLVIAVHLEEKQKPSFLFFLNAGAELSFLLLMLFPNFKTSRVPDAVERPHYDITTAPCSTVDAAFGPLCLAALQT